MALAGRSRSATAERPAAAWTAGGRRAGRRAGCSGVRVDLRRAAGARRRAAALHRTRTSFFYDEWDFVTNDYGGGLHTLLLAHVGNISVFPVAVYKVLFHVAG